MSEKKGLTRAKEIYDDRPSRARELKEEGKKIIGYPCIYAPVELMTALGIVPYRIFGDMGEPVTEADRALTATFCPFVRSLFDLSFKGKYDFLDGIVLVHSCDPQEKTAYCLKSYISYPYVHFLDIPGTIHPESMEYFKGQLKDLKKTLERFAGEELTPQKLNKAVELHNKQRALVRELYELRQPDPPLISGVETLQVMKAETSIPVEEGNELLTQVISEVKGRKNALEKKAGRLLIWSATVDNAELMALFENVANVVMDDYCGGSKGYGKDVKLTEDLVEGLAQHYLVDFMLSRTFREAVYGEARKDYMADLETRFGYLKRYVKEWNVNGVILLLVRSCDPFAMEMPALKDYLDSLGVPSTYIEHDYTRGALAPLTTRVEAFLEAIS
mgnify:CR=1 FL=1